MLKAIRIKSKNQLDIKERDQLMNNLKKNMKIKSKCENRTQK